MQFYKIKKFLSKNSFVYNVIKKFYLHIKNLSEQEIKLYQYREKDGTINFGDELSVDILNRLFHVKVNVTDLEHANFLAVGTILGLVSKKISNKKTKLLVWGSGIFENNSAIKELENYQNITYLAVRGMLTKNALGLNNSVAIGDPGLLSNLIYRDKVQKNGKIAIILHIGAFFYHKKEAEEFLKIIDKDERFFFIDYNNKPEYVANQIKASKLVISSAMHGLIMADSFGIPNAKLLSENDRLEGHKENGENNIKFEDYYSVVSKNFLKCQENLMFDDKYLDNLIDSYQPISNLKEIQRNLMQSFPKNWKKLIY
jgi:hypothetical protein